MTTETDSSRWIRCFRPAPEAPLRLACFPHAGGSAGYFHPVARALAPAVEVLAVQYPGRQDRYREPCLESVAELADGAVAALRPRAGRPLALFGHSLGAVVAFEVALRLSREGVGPVGLIVSGRRAPSRYRDESLHQASDSRLLGEIDRLSGTAAGVLDEPELVRMLLPALRADYRAVERYRSRPGAVVPCPVLVLTGDQDPLTSLDEARDWKAHTTGDCTVEAFPGGHFYLNDQAPQVISRIAGHLRGLVVGGS
ncbi:thioesterase II family protein [Streptomyces bohaiensis]|uniref:Thioesterase n=1 Tax=Streptomyces bohaiensis TaxID=1431344 RepID=A0ABX1CIJ7_9ACTN|nr:alpha/beta fold hydrolase [Streptomyces bohaiensis]NJQ16987.1 thioesterase [Streptomyces bohaiensis]